MQKGDLRELIPILDWLPEYDGERLRGDLRAGLTVGVMLIPQGMAYAVLAGMPPIHGLYASIVPLLVYPIFGSSRHLAVGVNASIMVIVAAGLAPLAEAGTEEYVGLAILLTGMVGLIEIAMGVGRLGFLSNLLSRPVIAGFTGAAALIIGFSQLGNLLGLDLPTSQYIHVVVLEAIDRVGNVEPLSLAIGVGGILVLLLCQRWKALFPAELTVLVLATGAAWALGLGERGVRLVGEVPAGLPIPAVPDLSLSDIGDLWTTALTLALVEFMTVVSLGRAISTRHRYTIEPDWELMAVGMGNFIGSFFRTIPASGSFSRTAVNEQAGARTPFANVAAAGLVFLALLFLTPIFRYLPLPALAAIIIVAAAGLVDVEEFRDILRAQRSDGYVAVFTFLATLIVGIREGILLGVGAAVVAVLYRLSRPHVAELGHLPSTQSFRRMDRFEASEPVDGILILRLEAGFSFFNATFFKDFVLERTEAGREEENGHRAVVIDGKSISYLDTTGVQALEEIVGTLESWEVEIHFTELTGPVRDVLSNSRVARELGEDHFHMNAHFAVEHILDRWDAEDRKGRLEAYREATREAMEEVEPTADTELQ